MKVEEKPVNKELELWRMTLPVDPCTIKGKVIHGKGIG
jgi:hypothetical protein